MSSPTYQVRRDQAHLWKLSQVQTAMRRLQPATPLQTYRYPVSWSLWSCKHHFPYKYASCRQCHSSARRGPFAAGTTRVRASRTCSARICNSTRTSTDATCCGFAHVPSITLYPRPPVTLYPRPPIYASSTHGGVFPSDGGAPAAILVSFTEHECSATFECCCERHF